MTVAQIRSAEWLVRHLERDAIVSMIELGSEGVVLKIKNEHPERWLIARDGVMMNNEGRILKPAVTEE